jgi:hypothetical protein
MYINNPSSRLPKLQLFQFLHRNRTDLRPRESSIRRRSLSLGLGYLQIMHRRDPSTIKEVHHTLEIQTDLIHAVAIIGQAEATAAGKELL